MVLESNGNSDALLAIKRLSKDVRRLHKGIVFPEGCRVRRKEQRLACIMQGLKCGCGCEAPHVALFLRSRRPLRFKLLHRPPAICHLSPPLIRSCVGSRMFRLRQCCLLITHLPLLAQVHLNIHT